MIKIMKKYFNSKLPALNTGLRINDFACILYLLVATTGLDGNEEHYETAIKQARNMTLKICRGIASEQNVFLAESDNVLEIIRDYFTKYPQRLGVEVSPTEMYRLLHNHAISNGMDSLGVKNSSWLTRRLIEKGKAIKSALGIDVTVKKERSGSVLIFNKVPDVDDESILRLVR
jgi:transcriptional regulator